MSIPIQAPARCDGCSLIAFPGEGNDLVDVKGKRLCPKCWKPDKGEPLTEAQMDLWNAEIDVAVAKIEARVGPHPKTPEYQVWLEAQRLSREAGEG